MLLNRLNLTLALVVLVTLLLIQPATTGMATYGKDYPTKKSADKSVPAISKTLSDKFTREINVPNACCASSIEKNVTRLEELFEKEFGEAEAVVEKLEEKPLAKCAGIVSETTCDQACASRNKRCMFAFYMDDDIHTGLFEDDDDPVREFYNCNQRIPAEEEGHWNNLLCTCC